MGDVNVILEANAWMMFHVYDHFDYTGDMVWWKAVGWPLLKVCFSSPLLVKVKLVRIHSGKYIGRREFPPR